MPKYTESMPDANSHQPRRTIDQFLDAAFDELDLEEQMRQLLRAPYREVRFELPLRRPDGSLAVFYGYRVQHDHSRGPFKGGLRYHPDLDLDHFVALASIMTQNRHRYQWSKERVNDELERRLHHAWTAVHERAEAQAISYRLAAYTMALERTIEAIELRGF